MKKNHQSKKSSINNRTIHKFSTSKSNNNFSNKSSIFLNLVSKEILVVKLKSMNKNSNSPNLKQKVKIGQKDINYN